MLYEHAFQVPRLSRGKNSGKGYPVSYKLLPISLLRSKRSSPDSGSLPFRSVVSEAARQITELYDKICEETKALRDLIDDAEDVADFVAEDIVKNITALEGETKRDKHFVLDLRIGLKEVKSDSAGKLFASELCGKWLAKKPKRSISERNISGVANLATIQAFLREKQISLLPRNEKLESKLSKERDIFFNVYVLFTRLNPLTTTVNELQKKREFVHFGKLHEEAKDKKSVFLVVDVEIHTSHKRELGEIKLYRQGTEVSLASPRKTPEIPLSFQSMPHPSEAASQAKCVESKGDPASNVTNICLQCKEFDEENPAEFVCISGCKKPYYCMDCWEHAHKRPKLCHHKRKKVADPSKLERKQTTLNLVRKEKISTLPKSSLPWKTLAPSLFQLFKVVLENAEANLFEKVVIVEEELAGLCNTFKPNCAAQDCSKIDFDSLKTFSVTSIGLTGDNRAIHRFLQSHLQFQDVEYDRMIDPSVCPTGLYALMPNIATLVVFYWKSGRDLSELENTRIACQMLRQVRDLCNEVVVCVEEKTFENLKFPRPENRDHLLYEDVTIDREDTRFEARASKGFDAAFDASNKEVIIFNGSQKLYLCTYDPSLIERSTGEKNWSIDQFKSWIKSLGNYKIIWKATLSLKKDTNNLENFLKIAFPSKAIKSTKEAKQETVRAFFSNPEVVEFCWKAAVRAFLAASYTIENNYEANDEKTSASAPFLAASIAREFFSQNQKKMTYEFNELRKKTATLAGLISQNKSRPDSTTFEEFYKFDLGAKEAFDKLTRRSESKSFFGELASDRKKIWSNFLSGGHYRPAEFLLPLDEELQRYHIKFYQNLRRIWLEKRLPLDNYLAIRESLYKLEESLRETTTSIEIGTGETNLEVTRFSMDSVVRTVSMLFKKFREEETKYKVFRLDVKINEKIGAGADPNYTFHPLFSAVNKAEMSVQNYDSCRGDIEVKAVYSTSYQDKLILVAYFKPSGVERDEQEMRTNGDVIVYVGTWRNLTKTEMKRFRNIRVNLVAFDAKTQLLALSDTYEEKVTVLKFKELLLGLGNHGEISLKKSPIGKDLLHMKFINGKGKILLVGSNSKGSICEIKSRVFTAASLDLNVQGETLADVISCNDFVFTVTKEVADVRTISSRCNFSVRAYSSETFGLVLQEKLYTFVNVNEKSHFRLAELPSQLHLVCIDAFSGECQSARLSLISPGTNIVKTCSNEECEDIKENEILENFYTIFRKYPITNCYLKETKALKVTFVIPQKPNLLESFQDGVESYFHSMFRALRDETGKQVDQLEKEMRLQTCFTDDMSAVFTNPYKPMNVNDFVLALATAVPIQIARAEKNLLHPLTKGMNVVLPISQTSTEILKSQISFGVYEAVLNYATAPTKVISATGKQSVGKSFLLNHMTGSLFDIAGGRCTQGVWMSIKLFPDVTVIALDFEGMGSVERSRQEDMYMAIFGAAVSSLTVFKIASQLDKDTMRLLDSFRDGADHLSKGDTKKQLFNGKLAILCKDVSDCDSEEVRKEVKGKLVQMLRNTSGDNFVAKLYKNKFRVLTSENFGKKGMLDSFDMLKDYVHEQDSKEKRTGSSDRRLRQRIRSAQNTANIMKTVLAKIHLEDWTTFNETEIKEILAQLRLHIKTAVTRGATIVGNETKQLHNLRNESDKVEDKKEPDLLSEQDFDLELYAKTGEKERRFKIIRNLVKKYKAIDQKEIGSSDWCSSFEEQLSDLAERRKSRVKEWINVNTSDLKDNSDLNSFKRETEARRFIPLSQFLTICQQKCNTCDRLCLHESHHSNRTPHDCYTDHKCDHACFYCTPSTKRIFACRYRGGHSGQHKCKDNEHTCTKACELSKFRQCNGHCCKDASHESAPGLQEHRCDAETHYCDKLCDLVDCENLCAKTFDHKGKHQCSIGYCPKVCTMCKNHCASKDHFHLPKNKTHFCDSEHACPELCESPGHCSVVASFKEHKEIAFHGKFGDFQYVLKARQVPKRLPCVIPIPVGEREHKGRHSHTPPNEPPAIHHCTATCPTCKNVCLKPYDHAGMHSTNHSNMVDQVFVGKSDIIKISDCTYAPGESARAEMCDQFCKRLGRGHTHLMCCQGEHPPDDIADGKVRHAVQTSPGGEDLDEVTHEYYWDHYRFEDNCNDAERKLYQKCNSVCETVEETFPDFTTENDSFCQLDLWHKPLKEQPDKEGHISAEGHYFRCTHTIVAGYHVVLLIDKSKSMGRTDQRPIDSSLRKVALDNRLGAVLETCNEFCRQRSREDKDYLTLITFDTSAKVQFEGAAMSAGISKICDEQKVVPGGDTKFGPALKQAKKSIKDFVDKNKEKNKRIVPLVILLTDGNCYDKEDAIKEAKSLKLDANDYPTPNVFCIMFGGKGVFGRVQAKVRAMGKAGSGLEILKEISSREKVHQSATAVELKEVLLEFHSEMKQEKIGVIEKKW